MADAGRDSAADLDAGGDPGADAGDPPDAGFLSDCRGDVLSFPAARAEGRVFSAAISGNRAQLVYLEPACGGSRARSNAQGLMHTSFETTGDASPPSPLVNIGPVACFTTRDPALSGDAAEGAPLFFVSNSAGSNELFSMDLAEGASPVRETSNAHRERAVVAAGLGADRRLRVAYVKEWASPDGARTMQIVTAGRGGPEHAISEPHAHSGAVKLALAGWPSSRGDLAGALAWVDDSSERGGIFFQLLDQAGQNSGDVRTLSRHPAASGEIAVAMGDGHGAVVYGVTAGGLTQELRFRALDADGTLGGEVPLTYSNQRVRDVSIAAYSTGYVVAYRRIGGPDDFRGSMRVKFVDRHGNVGRTRLVAPATVDGAGTQVLVARDGRLLVFWVDTESVTNPESGEPALENHVRVARVVCP